MLAIVPVKILEKVKSRLSKILTLEQRKDLSLAMFKDVLETLASANMLSSIVVVSKDSEIADISSQAGAEVFSETSYPGLNASLNEALSSLGSRTNDGIVVFPSDIPLLRVRDVHTVLNQTNEERRAVLVPSRDGDGTNCISLSENHNFRFDYGKNSYLRHKKQAFRLDLDVIELQIENIAYDVDQPNDLLGLVDKKPGDNTLDFLNSFYSTN